MRNSLQGYPTILIEINNKKYDYNGKRTADDIIKYINDNKENSVPTDTNKLKLVLYYAEWCGYCNKFMPIWDELVKHKHEKMQNIVSQKYKDTDNETRDANIKSYPTIMLYIGDNSYKYSGERTIDKLLESIEIKRKNEQNIDYYKKKYLKYKHKYLTARNKK